MHTTTATAQPVIGDRRPRRQRPGPGRKAGYADGTQRGARRTRTPPNEHPPHPVTLTAMDWTKTLDEWTHHGILCRIKPGGYSINGYAQLPAGHSDDLTADLDVHGCITYGPDTDGWIGFDTAHGGFGDYWAPDDLIGHIPEDHLADVARLCEMNVNQEDGRRWTLDDVRAETERLARQIAEAAGQCPTPSPDGRRIAGSGSAQDPWILKMPGADG